MHPPMQQLRRQFLHTIIPEEALRREAEKAAASKRLASEGKQKFEAAMAQPFKRLVEPAEMKHPSIQPRDNMADSMPAYVRQLLFTKCEHSSLAPVEAAYFHMENAKDFHLLSQRPTLRHSFYRSLNHHFTNHIQAEVAARQIEVREIEMRLRHKLEEIHLLLEKQVPLQARIDLVIDNEQNFEYPSEVDACVMRLGGLGDDCDSLPFDVQYNHLDHVCQGTILPQRNHFDTTIRKRCNKLCFLKEAPRQQLDHYEADLREVIARLGELKRDISTLEGHKERVDRSVRGGQISSRARHVVEKAKERHRLGQGSERCEGPQRVEYDECSDESEEAVTRIESYF